MENLTTKQGTKKAVNNNTTAKQVNNVLRAIEKPMPKVKLTKLERLNNALTKAQSENANAWDKLGGASAQTQLEIFSLSKISNVFCSSSFVDDIQRKILTFERIKTYVNNTPKFKDKTLFNANDIKLICNAILKTDDTRVKIALKVTKQGGTIKQK